MKKILIALVMISGTYLSADAKTKCACVTVKNGNAKHVSHARKAGSNYAENFHVCKNSYGYKICGETSTCSNSTYCIPGVNRDMDMAVANQTQFDDLDNSYSNYYNSSAADQPVTQAKMVAPQSQSYPAVTDNRPAYNSVAYGNTAKVVVYNDNATAPYEGLPSPQDDGPAKNIARNINENTPAQSATNRDVALPPASGSGSRLARR